MKFNVIGFTVGLLLLVLGIVMLIPAWLDWGESVNAKIFFESSLVSIFFGGALTFANRAPVNKLTIRESFLLTTLSWLTLSFFAAIPLWLSNLEISFVDAFFEAVSGMTTTGSTVFTGLDDMSRGILLWRSITQWLGGIGVIGFAIVILPFLRIGGMQLFRTETSDRSEKVMPRTKRIASSIFSVYVGLTCLIALVYHLLGMSGFDAVNHAMTTIATAGFSPHDGSFGHFDSYALEMAAIVFMIMGGSPFVLYISLFFHGKFEFFRDDQFKTYLGIIIASVAFLTLWLWGHGMYDLANSFRYAAFNITSILTTTGYVTDNYVQWGTAPALFFLFAMYLGGCAGSTASGVKIMRLVVLTKLVNRQLKNLIYPNAVFTAHYQGRTLTKDTALTVFGFLGIFVISNAVGTLVLSATGLDFITAISAVANAFSNIGPGLGEVIGPAGNYASLTDTAKLTLCFAMIAGRLEIITVLVLFTRTFWRS
jgi:trk system potassium uptake protein TrkH